MKSPNEKVFDEISSRASIQENLRKCKKNMIIEKKIEFTTRLGTQET